MSSYMGTLFIRLKQKGKTIEDLEYYLLNQIAHRTPVGLIKKDRSPTARTKGNEGIKHVETGDFVVVLHQKGYFGKSGIAATGKATTKCLSIGQDRTNPSLSPLEPFGVALDSIEWHRNKVSTTDELIPAISKIDTKLKLSGPGWRYSNHDLTNCVQRLLADWN